MRSGRRPSARRSSGKKRRKQPRRLPTLLLDESICSVPLLEELRKLGFRAHPQDKLVSRGASDEEVLRAAARKKWVLVTRDKRMQRRPSEVAAIRQEKAALLVLAGAKDLRLVEYAAVLKNGRNRLAKLFAENPRPVIIRIANDGNCSVVPLGSQKDRDPSDSG